MAIKDLYPLTRPTLDLNFAGSRTVDPRIAFTRASTATYFDEFGVMRTAPANTPRIDFDPVTGKSLGLLIEEQRTNLLKYSEQFDNAAWTQTRTTIAANTIVAPDGTLTGDKLVEDTTASSSHILRSTSATFAAGTAYTFSFFVKAAERSHTFFQFRIAAFTSNLGVVFDIANTAILSNAASAWATASIVDVGNGWRRISVTATATANYTGNDAFYLYVMQDGITTAYTGNGTSGVYIWGAQLESGAFPTSYIKTEASQVTRAADSASMSGANFSSWNNTTGTLLAKYRNSGWQSNNTPPTTQLDITKYIQDYSTPIVSDSIERVMFYPRQLTDAQIAALKG